MTIKLKKMISQHFQLDVMTGLHIGAGNDVMKIGGIDSPVVRNPITDEPYIPGSSLKGKMRSLLETARGKQDDAAICALFGSSAGSQTATVTRLLVRDAHMTAEWRERFQLSRKEGGEFMEEKAEVTIPRGGDMRHGPGPRFIERIPAGVRFEFDLVLRIFDEDDEKEFISLIEESIQLLHNDALGGSGSRGYGQVLITGTGWNPAA